MVQVLQKPETREAFCKLLKPPPDHWDTAKKLMADIRESRAAKAAEAEREFRRLPKDRAEWEARKVQERQSFEALPDRSGPAAPASAEEMAARRTATEQRVNEQAGRAHGLFDPAAAQSRSEMAASQSALNSIHGVNPEGSHANCMECVMATYDHHHGVSGCQPSVTP